MERSFIRKLSALGLAVAVTSAVVAIATADSGTEPALKADLAAADVPFAAFSRPAMASDQLPPELATGPQRLAGQAGGSSRLIAAIDGHRFYVQTISDLLCLGVSYPNGQGAMTCNSADGMAKGQLFLGDPDGFVGLVPENVASVVFVDADGQIVKTVKTNNGAYVADGVRGTATQLRFAPKMVGGETFAEVVFQLPGWPPGTPPPAAG